jgi:tRNA uridine 5-carbamoylmethylation protein Kti12
MEFQQIFLMTYQSFTTPEKLLQKLMQRYQPPESAQKRFSEQVNVLKKWLGRNSKSDGNLIEKGNHWSDLNEQHIETFKSFMEKNIKATSEKLYTLLSRKIKVNHLLISDIDLLIRDNKMRKSSWYSRILLLNQR